MSTKIADKQKQELIEEQTKSTENEQISAKVEETAQPVAETEVEALQDQLEAAQAEASKNLDGWQRAAAELANYKKRQEEQVGRRRESITAHIISQLFPVLDDLDLAFQNLPAELTNQEKNWLEGFNLVQRKLLKILEQNNVEVINTEGEFDPSFHEAVTHEESPDHESHAIIAELRKGYKLGDRVLRPALVRVAQ